MDRVLSLYFREFLRLAEAAVSASEDMSVLLSPLRFCILVCASLLYVVYNIVLCSVASPFESEKILFSF